MRADLDTGATLYHYSTLCRADSEAISEIMVVAERVTAVWGLTGYALR